MFRRLAAITFLFTVYMSLLSSCVGIMRSPKIRASFPDFPDLYEASIAELQSGLHNGHFTSVDLVKVSHFLQN